MSEPATLLPPNSTPLERAVDRSMAARHAALPALVPSLWNADTCPAALLPYLAWAVSVDEWDEGWSVDKKRAAIREAPEIHRRKGTPSAIRRALTALGQGDADLIERSDFITRNGIPLRNGIHRRRGHAGWATYRVILKRAIPLSQAQLIKRLLAAVQRNCIELVAIDYRGAAVQRKGSITRNGAYTRGVVDTSI